MLEELPLCRTMLQIVRVPKASPKVSTVYSRWIVNKGVLEPTSLAVEVRLPHAIDERET